MQIKQAISEWANRWFFIKERKPRVAIGLSSVAVGLAVGIGLDIYRRTHGEFFLNHYGRIFDVSVRFVAAIVTTVVVLLFVSGIFKICKR